METEAQAIGESWETPANGSRFHSSRDEALAQPIGTLEFAWDLVNPLLVNGAYQDSLILFDDSYCTSTGILGSEERFPTLTYFDRVLARLPARPTVIEIGCGQGEFVDALRSRGLAATGFDPVVRQPNAHLFPRYWNSEDNAADLYVMRCVLPHIQDPWSFLEGIALASSTSLVLIEYQRIEWAIEHEVWYAVGHGHVNYFREHDFHSRFDVVDRGTFSGGEWAWVLLDPASYSPARVAVCGIETEVASLGRKRKTFLDTAAMVSRPIALWGGSGKGIILGHSLVECGANVQSVVDAAPVRWGNFLEVSGLQVVSPEYALKTLPQSTIVFVCNPNHLEAVKTFASGGLEIVLPSGMEMVNNR